MKKIIITIILSLLIAGLFAQIIFGLEWGYSQETCARLMQDCGFVYDSYNKKEEIETYFNTDVHNAIVAVGLKYQKGKLDRVVCMLNTYDYDRFTITFATLCTLMKYYDSFDYCDDTGYVWHYDKNLSIYLNKQDSYILFYKP